MLPASTNTRSDRESVERQDRRPHPRDLPPDRPLAARGHRLQGARREHHRPRLRRPPGRRRHPHRRDHRRVRRPRRRRAPTCDVGRTSRSPARSPPSASASSTACPRLDLPYEEDVRAETDMNVVMTGDGKFVEVQGTAEGAAFDRAELDALLALADEGLRRPHPPPAGGARRWLRRRPAGLPGLPQRQEARGDAAGSCAEHVPDVEVLGLDDVPPYDEPVEDQPDVRGQRAAQGPRGGARPPACRRSPTTAGSASTRSTGCPACCPRAGPGLPKDDDRNNELLLAQLEDVPDERRGAHFACAVAFAYPVGAGGVAEHVVHGEMAGRVIREVRGSGGFGYDVLFCADGPRRHHRGAAAGGEGRDLAPGQGPARDRARGRRRAGRPLTSLRPTCRRARRDRCPDGLVVGCGVSRLTAPCGRRSRRARCSRPAGAAGRRTWPRSGRRSPIVGITTTAQLSATIGQKRDSALPAAGDGDPDADEEHAHHRQRPEQVEQQPAGLVEVGDLRWRRRTSSRSPG